MTPFDFLAIAVIIYEAVGIVARRRDWTISGKFWNLRSWRPPYGRMLNDGLWVWVVFHLVFDAAWGVTGASLIDLLVVAAGAGGGLIDWGKALMRRDSTDGR